MLNMMVGGSIMMLLDNVSVLGVVMCGVLI